MKVLTSDFHSIPFDRQCIVSSLLEETKLCAEFTDVGQMPLLDATAVACKTEEKLRSLNLPTVTTSLIRSVVSGVILDLARDQPNMMEWYTVTNKVGMSVYEAFKTDIGGGFEDKENANLSDNPEKSHKKKADNMSKAQNLALMPWYLAESHLQGDIHIHDLEYLGTRPFCADHDLRYFFYYGLYPSGDSMYSSVSRPAQNAEVAILHAVKAMGSAQTNFAGGQGFYNFLTFIAPYLENKSPKQIRQLMQMFIYELMQMYVARGGQVIFSSVQLTPGVPKIWRDRPAVYKGQVSSRTYGEFEYEVRLAFSSFMDVMLEGDANGKPFSFPKPEISIEKCFVEPDEWVKEFEDLHAWVPSYKELYAKAFRLAAKFGTPYFDNQLPEYRGDGTAIECYQCCAYRFQNGPEDRYFEDKMEFRDGKHFSMGSWQVVSINCPRAAYKAEHDDTALMTELYSAVDKAIDLFKHKRKLMDKVMDDRLPFATQRPVDPNNKSTRAPSLVDLEGYVYTIGLVGINDMVKYHTGYGIHEDASAKKLALRVILELQQLLDERGHIDGVTYALARTPAETTGQRFAVCDLLNDEFSEKAKRIVQGDVETALEKAGKTRDLPVYYTNGTHIPPSASVSLAERINHEHIFFPSLAGGNILHVWVGEAWSDERGLGDLIMNICKNTQVGYFAITKDLTVCKDCHRVYGTITDKCEWCESENITYMSRITGYLQDVESWNEGKKQEFRDRTRYQIGGKTNGA